MWGSPSTQFAKSTWVRNVAKEFPEWIDPWKAAEGRRMFSGSLPLRGFARLKPLLAGCEGEVAFSARFYLDAQKRATVDVHVDVDLMQTCQLEATLRVGVRRVAPDESGVLAPQLHA